MIKTLILLAIILPSCAMASGNRNNNITNVTNVFNTYNTDGTALSLAVSAPQYDYNIKGLQLGIGGGWYDENSAIAIGAGKRMCFSEGNCGMFNFTFGLEEGGETGGNVGFTWRL